MMARSASAALVKVVKCSNSGGVSAVGTVDVQPLVNQVDRDGNATPHGIVYGLPYFRAQGGANAVIIDPVAGDIGVAVFCDRDISTVKATKAQANPGSRRRNDWADGLYFGGFLNGTPSQFVEFSSAGITITSTSNVTINAPGTITLSAPQIALNGAVSQTAGTAGGTVSLVGPVNVVNDVTAGTISLKNHLHTGVQTGGSNTGHAI
jgi:hypothetical protein